MKPKLSLIMPVYNAAKFLKRSVDSVLNQTFDDLELILVNDGSTDDSLSICREYEKKDKRVTVIDQKNAGAGPARNRGIEAATGEYLAFPDSDDWLDLNCYEICLKKIEECDADLLVFGVRTYVHGTSEEEVTETREETVSPVSFHTKEECRANWVSLHKSCNMNSPCNKIYKRSILAENDLRFPDLRRMQDGVFNMYYYDKISSIVVIEENLFNRSWHTNAFQNKKLPKDLLRCAIAYRETALSCLKNWNADRIEGKRFFDLLFLETIHMMEFIYGPQDVKPIALYRHIKNINNDPYVHHFLREWKKSGNALRKKERLMLHKCNFALAVWRYFR